MKKKLNFSQITEKVKKISIKHVSQIKIFYFTNLRVPLIDSSLSLLALVRWEEGGQKTAFLHGPLWEFRQV